MRTSIYLFTAYIRRAFQHGGVWLPLLLSLGTTLMLLFAVHTTLPDTTADGMRTESHRLLYLFPETVSATELAAFDDSACEGLYSELCAVSLTDSEGVCLLAVKQAEQLMDARPSDGEDEEHPAFTLSAALIPDSAFAQLTKLSLSVNGLSFSCQGIVETTDDAHLPNLLPPCFHQQNQNTLRAHVLLNGELPSITDENLQHRLSEDMTKVIAPEQLDIAQMRYTGNTVGDSYAALCVPFSCVQAADVPVHALYVTTFLPAEQVKDQMDALLPPGTWESAADIDEMLMVDSFSRCAGMIQRTMPGFIPFYALLLLSQMALWGLWLDRYGRMVGSLHLQGCGYTRQAVVLCCMTLLLQALAYGVGLCIFLLVYPLLEKERVLWQFDWKAVLLSFAAYFCCHGLYTFFYCAVRRAKWGKEVER